MMDHPQRKYRTILLFGMLGSGKGTQGAVLGQLPFCVHISMGEVFRKLPKWGQLGREVLDFTSQGKMVPDDLTVRIYQRYIMVLEMQELLSDQHLLILDGLPRNYEQAKSLHSMLDVVQIFHLKITNKREAMERLKARALRENRLDDINEEVIQRRLRIYDQETIKTLSFYDPSIICEVEASQAPLFVMRDIIDRLAKLEADKLGFLGNPSEAAEVITAPAMNTAPPAVSS